MHDVFWENRNIYVMGSWNKDGSSWKARYSRLYSNRSLLSKEDSQKSFSSRFSYPKIVVYPRQSPRERATSICAPGLAVARGFSSTSGALENNGSIQSHDFGEHDTMLLDMVRARSREHEDEALDEPLDLPRDDMSDDDSVEACVHGLGVRNNTDGSVSRSRISRMSTRRDMDIPSILAFTASVSTPLQIPIGIPAFQGAATPPGEEIPRWSIRRSICPVCSQKWRDRSSIKNVKYSGLKRNSSSDLPSVIAPARLRTSITLDYIPRPVQAALDEEAGMSHSGWRSAKSSWQLTRARRFRTPKPLLPSPEASAPPGASAPTARKDLDTRVYRFLSY